MSFIIGLQNNSRQVVTTAGFTKLNVSNKSTDNQETKSRKTNLVLDMSNSKQDELLKKIDGKIRMLSFTRDDTQRILEENKLKALERHEKVFVDLCIEEMHGLKVEVQRTRIENGDKPHGVRKWSLGQK